jgi:hypothetical protein
MTTTAPIISLPAELRPALADFTVLAMYDAQRFYRYGDMARSRRDRELRRRLEDLHAGGFRYELELGQWDLAEVALELLTRDEVIAGYDRIITPRRRRFEREPGARFRTREAQATAEAYDALARRINGLGGLEVDTEPPTGCSYCLERIAGRMRSACPSHGDEWPVGR